MNLNYELINGGTAYQVIGDVYNIENLIVPDIYNNLPVIGIGGDAFLGNGYLKTITLGNNIEFIGVSAFEACQYLNMVTIGKNLISIGNSAFNSSSNLTRVYFNGNAPAFGSTLFDLTSPNLKLYRKKNFVTGWPNSVQGVPVVLWSDNVIKSGGTGKLIARGYKMQDLDAKNYVDKVEGLEKKMLESEVRKAIDLFVIGCKTDGIWTKIKHSCLLAGPRTLNGALIPLKGSAPTNINFINSDYDRKTGLKANGNINGPIPSPTNKMIDTNVSSFDLGINQHASLYLAEKSTIDGHYLSTLLTGSNIHTIIGFSASSLKINILNCTSSSSVSTSGNLHKIGFLGASRIESTNINFRGDKTNEVISSNNLGFPISTNINLFGKYGTILPYTGSVNNTNGKISFYSLGDGLSTTELTYLDNRISTFIEQLSALNI